MMPPAYVRRQKNDAADAAGICEAVTRSSMRCVGMRTLENQATLMHHKARGMRVATAPERPLLAAHAANTRN